jgi:amino acid adenylation domain-containing protein/non-ribosomal peptide synthase protein (TIGR01720 family)
MSMRAESSPTNDRKADSARQYWVKTLSMDYVSEVIPISQNRGRSGVAEESLTIEIAGETYDRLMKMTSQSSFLRYVVLLAVAKVCVYKYSRKNTIAVGGLTRTLDEKSNNSPSRFPIVSHVDERVSFRSLLLSLKDSLVESHQYSDAPLADLAASADGKRHESIYPQFSLLLNEFHGDRRSVRQSGVILRFEKEAGALQGVFEYDQKLYDPETIRRFRDDYSTILDQALQDTAVSINDLSAVTAAEKRRILYEWNRTSSPFPESACAHELFALQAQYTPDATAIICGNQNLSYIGLDQRVNHLANYLKAIDVKTEERVGLCLDRSVEMVVGLLAVLKSGGAYVPLNPGYPSERLAYLIEDAQIKTILTLRPYFDGLPESGPRVICLEEEWKSIRELSGRAPSNNIAPDNLAYILYTSGSTGQPKGVAVHHQALVARTVGLIEVFEFTAADRLLQFVSPSFDVYGEEIFPTLCCGASLVIDPGAISRSAQDLCGLMDEQEITVVHITPALWHQFVDELSLNRRSVSKQLRLFITGGESPSLEKLKKWAALTNQQSKFVNAYGPTEATITASVYELQMRLDEVRLQTVLPIGRPIKNTQLYILDANLESSPIGVIGELYIGGVGVARGYLGQADLSAEKFVPHPFSDQDGVRIYRTGDLCRRLMNGDIEFIGRVDEQVKIRGHRIELGEIESALNKHPSVRQSVVLANEDDNGIRRLVAYAEIEGESTGAELKKHLSMRLPDYMIPPTVFTTAEMPLTANGKIDRKKLHLINEADVHSEHKYAGARTPAESLLVEIFQTTLKRDRVGIHENFFELGGDSILSIQIISRANEAGLGLTPKQLFERQTIAELAAIAGAVDKVEVEDGSGVGEAPLTPIQEWFFDGSVIDPDHCNQAVMLESREPLDLEALETVIRLLIHQHDALRHKFQKIGGKWKVFCYEDADEISLERVDLSAVDESLEGQAIEEWAGQYQKQINLSQGPLMKVVAFGGKGRRQRLLIIIHHLVVDGVSWRILLGDLERGYEHAKKGEQIRFGARTSSYKRWAERLKAESQREELKNEAGYWLTGVENRVESLPADMDGDNTVASGRNVFATLDEDLTRGLLQEVPKIFKTQINEVLLTAVARALCEWTQAPATLVDMEWHGREDVVKGIDLTRTVGCFTVFYPLRLTPTGVDSVEALRTVKEQYRKVGRRGVYFGMLKYLSDSSMLQEQLRAISEPQVSFNYLGQLDLVLKEESLFHGAKESPGEMRSRNAKRRHLLDVNGSVAGGKLHLLWTYSENIFHRATIEAVAQSALNSLKEIVESCRSHCKPPYTLSDFPLAKLDQRKLDLLVSAESPLEDIYGLSPLQTAMLFHTLSGVNPEALFIQLTCSLRGQVNFPALKKAWQRLIDRHPIFRTAYEWEELDEPVQVVHRRAEMPIEYLDWMGQSADEEASAFRSLLDADRERQFELSKPPLMRLTLIRVGDDFHRLVWSHHHLLGDGWSGPLILQEVFSFYEGYERGVEQEMEDRAPYRDYIAWLSRQDSKKAERYWRDRLKGFEHPVRLWIDRGQARLSGRREIFEDQRARLSEAVSGKLQGFARKRRLTMNTILQGVWAMLLGKYSGNEDLVFGATVSGRPVDLAGSDSIIGPFINTLPIRIKLAYQSPIVSWLGEIQKEQVEFGQYAYSSLVEQYSDAPPGAPLYESILIFENYPTERSTRRSKRAVEISGVKAPVRTKYPLTIVSGQHSEIPVTIAYDLSRFDRQDITRLLEHLLNLIQGLAANPDQPLWSLSLLSRKEREQLLSNWRGAREADEDEISALRLIEAQAENRSDAIAVTCGDRFLSYDELNKRSNQLAAYLRRLGVKPETKVGVYLEDPISLLAGALGIIKAGGACIRLADRDDGLKTLDAMQASALLTEGSLPEQGGEFKGKIVSMDSDWEKIEREGGRNTAHSVTGGNLALIIDTAGEEAEAKRVMITHRGWGRHLKSRYETVNLTAEDSVLEKLAWWEMFWPILGGGRLVIGSSWESGAIEDIANLIEAEQITIASLTPSLCTSLFRKERVRRETSLRDVILSGERPSWRLQEVVIDDFNLKLHNLYSVSELSGGVWKESSSKKQNGETLSLGEALTNAQLYILDEQLEPSPTGVGGEIWISGSGLARGYAEEAGRTAEIFRPNPFVENGGERMARTLDLGREVGNGKIAISRRRMLEEERIEKALLEHSEIAQAVVIGHEKESKAYLLYENTEGSTEEQLRRILQESIFGYLPPPVLIRLEQFPLKKNGRVDRKALAERNGEWGSIGSGGTSHKAPSEEILSAIWRNLLGVTLLNDSDNFFEMGGHSLLATQLMSRVREIFQIELPLRSVFENPTIGALGRKIEETIRADAMDAAPPLVKVAREGAPPLSFAQQRLWFLDQLAPNNPFYNCSGAVRLEGGLAFAALQSAINEIIRRHEILRTRIEIRNGEPVQIVDAWRLREIEIIDLSSWSPLEKGQEARRRGTADAMRGFDLSSGPLLRVTVLKLEEEEHVLLFTMHHIVSDGWSMGILIREFGILYQAYQANEPSPLKDLEIQYADFAVWQRQWLQGEALEKKLEYWRKQLSGVKELELPLDHPRPTALSYRGMSQRFVVDAELAEKLRALSRQAGTTLYMTLLGGFDVLLSRYSGQEDIAVGADIANRNRAEIEELIGFFVNQLVLRVEIRPREDTHRFLKRVREVCLEAYAHQDVPFEKLVEELQPERDLSRSPLFQAKLILQNAPREGLELKGVKLSGVGGEAQSVNEMQTARFDLTMAFTDYGRSLGGIVEYSRDLFERSTIERLMSHFRNVLAEMTTAIDRPIAELNLLRASEREQLVIEWNRTTKSYPKDRCIHELFERQVDSTPDSIALICQDRRLSYSALNALANRMAHSLLRLGVGPETLVGICLDRNLEMAASILGVLKAGAAYLPIDPAYPIDRITYTLEDAEVKVLLAEKRRLKAIPSESERFLMLDPELSLKAIENEKNPVCKATADNLAYVIYTSGSTGRPKGVSVPHRQIANFFTAMDACIEPDRDGIWLAVTSISFDISVLELLWTLARGCQVVLQAEQKYETGSSMIPGEAEAPLFLPEEIVLHQVSHFQCTPSMARRLLLELNPNAGLNSLRKFLIGGEALAVDLAMGLASRLKAEIYNMYGPTETTIWSTTYKLCGDENKIPIGQPIANTQTYILDRELELSPIGVPGELYIGGEGVVRGYLKRPGITGERFIPDSFSGASGSRLYRTGDVARLRADGRIEFLGRSDHQVKIRGYRIELGEIEALLNSHPSVKQCVVIARKEDIGEDILVAYVVYEESPAPSVRELRAYLKEKTPDYMLPAWFVMLGELPLTPNGKVDRKALPAPKTKRGAEERGGLLPRTPVEEIVMGVYEDVLKVNSVGRQESFFELGGHSLLATQVISRLRKTFGIEIGVRSIFEKATVEGLAGKLEAEIRRGGQDCAPALVKIAHGSMAPLSFAQQRLWFIEQLNPGNPAYNILGSVKLPGDLDLEAMEAAVNEIIRRHEILRTRIEVRSGDPVQVIDEWIPLTVIPDDLSGLSPEGETEALHRRRREEAGAGFDLTRGPLFRIRLLKMSDGEHLALFTMHHIVSDGWSMSVLRKELGALYEAYRRDEASPLEELPIQYSDYALWQRQWLEGERLEKELAYWRAQLDGMEDLALPLDYNRPLSPSYRGANLSFIIAQDLTEKLREIGKQEGATLFMTVLGAFDILLGRYSRQDDIVIGTDVANRDRAEVEGLIGFFVNQLVLRVKLKTGENFKALLRQVREICLEAYAHQNAPFEKLVEATRPGRDVSRSPIFQTKLILQNASRAVLDLSGPRINGDGGLAQFSRFDLTLAVVDEGRNLTGLVNYSPDLFEGETIERLIGHFVNILREVVETDKFVSELNLLSPEEQRQIIVEWNQTDRPFSPGQFMHRLFLAQAEEFPERIALFSNCGQLSFQELNRKANQLAHYLQSSGVGPEIVVGLYMRRSLEMVIGLLGTLKAGGAYLPLDPELPFERIAYVLENAGVGLILTEQKLEDQLPSFLGRTVCLDLEREQIGKQSDREPRIEVEEDNLAYLIYTSGSTGKPKGVMITHRGLGNYLAWAKEIYRIDEGEGAPVHSSIGFDLTITGLYGPLVSGTRVDLLQEDVGVESLGLNLMHEHGYSLVKLTPAHLELLTRQLDETDVEGRTKVFVIGGEQLRSNDVNFWRERAKGTRLINEYGPTETVVGCCVYEVDGSEIQREAIPIGTPIANTQIYLVDPALTASPVGVHGEICISGAGLARGYAGRPDLTAERFIPNPFGRIRGDKTYKSGDLGRRLSDGALEYVGRTDRQVKIRGYRIELGEIEAVLNEHPSVRQSVVLLNEDQAGESRLFGYVVGAEELNIAELKRRLHEKLPAYMVPEAILSLPAMPMTSNGKIDRAKLPTVKGFLEQTRREYVAPRAPVEEIVAGIIAGVLNLDRVGIQDNFFELGGHSLLAMQVVLQVKDRLGIEIGVGAVFETPTAKALARRIEDLKSGRENAPEAPALGRTLRVGPNHNRAALSFAQQRLWFLEQLEPGNAVYNIPGAVMLEGNLNLDSLERVINEIFRRHEVLRTRFEIVDSEPAQVIDEWKPINLDVRDLTHLSVEDQEREIRNTSSSEAQTGFDLRHGPLIRVKTLKLGEELHAVFFTMHHIISDGWSIGVLIQEVGALYPAFEAGEPSPLEELEIQYADYAAWQRRRVQEEFLEKQLAYWRRHLGGNLQPLRLVIDRSTAERGSHRGGEQSLILPANLAQDLRALSRREGVTLFITLLAAFKVLLFRYSGQEDLIVGAVIANRFSAELEKLIGFFVNTLPLRTDLSGNPTFRELLTRVREIVTSAYIHQDAPLEKIVDETHPELRRNQTPLFRTAFVLQNTPTPPIQLSGLSFKPLNLGRRMAKFDLSMLMVEHQERLISILEYDADLFDDSEMMKMLMHYRRLLEEIVRSPDQPILSLRLLNDEDIPDQELPESLDVQLTPAEYENILLQLDRA